MEQNVLDGMYEQLGISKEVLDYAADIEESLKAVIDSYGGGASLCRRKANAERLLKRLRIRHGIFQVEWR